MEHTVKTFAGVWYTITCNAPATVAEEINGIPVPLATLDNAGSTHFRSSGSTIIITTDGSYRILPFA